MGRGETDSARLEAGRLFSRRQRRGVAGSLALQRAQAALERLERGDDRDVRELLHRGGLGSQQRSRLLGRLAEYETKQLYAHRQVACDPAHREFELLAAEARERLEELPREPVAATLVQNLPPQIWDCDPLGPLAEHFCETLSVWCPASEHVSALAARPDSALGARAREQLFEELRRGVHRAFLSLGCDDGNHRYAVRVAVGRRRVIHLRQLGQGDPLRAATRLRCGLVAPEFYPVERQETGASLAGHPDACRRCLAVAEEDGFDHSDPRPPVSPLGGRERALREALLGRFDEVAAELPQTPWPNLLHSAFRGNRHAREALYPVLLELFKERLAGSPSTLRDLPGKQGEGLAERYGDLALRDVLRDGDLEEAVREFSATLSSQPFVAAVEEALARREERAGTR